jgi:hypothetical protein
MFVFPGQISIDAKSTLDQLTPQFRSVRDGLPELVKNSKDQYARLKIRERQQRQIVVIADRKTRSLGVLDFAGAPRDNYEGWETWSNPNAGRSDLAEDIEAGHGNGGKAFMVRGAEDYAFMESCFRGKRNAMGFENRIEAVRYQASFMTDRGIVLDDVAELNPRARLDKFLAKLGHTFSDLPKHSQDLFAKRQAFTGVYLHRVSEWMHRRQPTLRRIPAELVEILGTHGQSALTIATCDAWVVVDRVVDGPIQPTTLEPYPGFEDVRELVVPDLLSDPETGEIVKMLGTGKLRLHTSVQQLQISPETRAKNVIRVWNERNNVATWPLNSLGVLMTAVSYVYGELRYSGLTAEHESGAERHDLVLTPLTRALKKWTRDCVECLANELHKAMVASTKPKEREHARNALNKFRDLMKDYLRADSPGAEDEEVASGAGGQNGTGQKRTRTGVPFGDRVDQIILELGGPDLFVATGTTVPLRYQVLEVHGDGTTKPVRKAELLLKSEPAGIVGEGDPLWLSGVASGVTKIWLETPEGTVRSNEKEVWVVDATAVDATLPVVPLLQGQKLSLGLSFQTAEGPLDEAMIDGEVVPPEAGAIGRRGRFTAGMQEGEANVRVRYGASQFRDFVLQIGPDRVQPPEGKGEGSDIPLILLCGETAPGKEKELESKQTHEDGPNLPTIIEDRALFPGIVWLNPNSKEAQRVRTSVGGSSGVVGLETKTFTHFVALKCFEILKRLYVRQQIAGGMVTEDQYMQLAAYSEIECSGFIDAAWELSDTILKSGGSAA